MNLDGIRLQLVDLDNIVSLYHEKVSNANQKRLLKVLMQGKELSSFMILEKDYKEDVFWLVAGYPEYKAYKSAFQMYGGKKDILCVVQSYSSKTEQRITLLKRVFQHQTTKWHDKHMLIDQLINEGTDLAHIAHNIGVTISDLERYRINKDIPPEIVSRAKINKCSFLILEEVQKLNLHSAVIGFLYEQCVLPKGNKYRITNDKLEKLKWLFKRKGFQELTYDQQKIMITSCINYREFLEKNWDKEMKNLLMKDINKRVRINTFTLLNKKRINS